MNRFGGLIWRPGTRDGAGTTKRLVDRHFIMILKCKTRLANKSMTTTVTELYKIKINMGDNYN